MAPRVFLALPRGHGQSGDFAVDQAECLQAVLNRTDLQVFRSDAQRPVREIHTLPLLELRMIDDRAFQIAWAAWTRHIQQAHADRRPGDMLVLAEEAPTRSLEAWARHAAGALLTRQGQHSLALEHMEKSLEMDPEQREAQRDKALLLGRMGDFDHALAWARSLLERHPDEPEDLFLLGLLEEEEWLRRWRRMEAAAPAPGHRPPGEMPRLMRAMDHFRQAFLRDTTHFRAGIHACTLGHILRHLGASLTSPDNLTRMEGGVGWACLATVERRPQDGLARTARAELEILHGAPAEVTRAWHQALEAIQQDWYALDASRQRLTFLRDLGFRPDAVAAALAVLDSAISRLEPPWSPRRVFLFSGHMIDAPGRARPRFPAEAETAAAQSIATRLDELGMGAADLALCGGACGGDTLFAEAALRRGCRLELFLQFPEPEFLRDSVAFAGETWVARYHALKAHPRTRIREQRADLGPPPESRDPYVRNNLWQLHSALAQGPDKLHLLALWNGEGGAGPGGTQHMVDSVRRHHGQVSILDTRQLFTP